MNIKTKYDIGDKVWVIHLSCPSGGRYYVYHIKQRVANVEKNKCGFLYHLVDGDGCFDEEYEQNLFPTKKDAQAECDRRNKK